MRDSILPIFCLVLVAMIVVPIPYHLLDLLLVANLVSAVVLLGNALFVREPMKLSSLPAMLLMATLFRLSLNISTTRLILGHGNAGTVVEAFGNFAVEGNLIVGLVVFLVLTLVQFIVVAKGSERVAEVAARFALDALPGKQMAIDADLRSGLIDSAVAKKRRDELQLESRFFGALDGSMKFVKGDAIAGLIITAINLVGGMLIGLVVHGMSAGVAAQTYSLLTIGDGLLTQIPSLLNSLAAGFIVTRVNSNEDAVLAREVLSQIGHIHQVKKLAGAAAVLLGCVPGLPTLPFVVIGILLLISGFRSKPVAADEEQQDVFETFSPTIPPLLSLSVTKNDFITLGERKLAEHFFEPVKSELFRRWGLVIREALLELGQGHDGEFRIYFRGVQVGKVPVQKTFEESCGAVRRELLKQIELSKCEFVDDISTQRILDALEAAYSDPVAALTRQQITVTQVTDVLRNLIAEDISIRNMDLIIQAIVEHAKDAGSPRRLIEEVRVCLSRVISAKYANDKREIPVYQLDTLLDLALVEHENGTAALAPEVSAVILSAAGELPDDAIVMSCSRRSRALLRDISRLRSKKFHFITQDEVVDGYTTVVSGLISPKDQDTRERVASFLAAA